MENQANIELVPERGLLAHAIVYGLPHLKDLFKLLCWPCNLVFFDLFPPFLLILRLKVSILANLTANCFVLFVQYLYDLEELSAAIID